MSDIETSEVVELCSLLTQYAESLAASGLDTSVSGFILEENMGFVKICFKNNNLVIPPVVMSTSWIFESSFQDFVSFVATREVLANVVKTKKAKTT